MDRFDRIDSATELQNAKLPLRCNLAELSTGDLVPTVTVADDEPYRVGMLRQRYRRLRLHELAGNVYWLVTEDRAVIVWKFYSPGYVTFSVRFEFGNPEHVEVLRSVVTTGRLGVHSENTWNRLTGREPVLMLDAAPEQLLNATGETLRGLREE